MTELDRKARQSMSSYERTDLDSLANQLLEKATKAGNKTFEAKAHLYLSSYDKDSSESSRKEKLSHLEKAEEIAVELDNDTLLCYI